MSNGWCPDTETLEFDPELDESETFDHLYDDEVWEGEVRQRGSSGRPPRASGRFRRRPRYQARPRPTNRRRGGDDALNSPESDASVDEEEFIGSIWSSLTRSRIEDRTHLTPKSKRIRKRDPSTVDALVLHQMAFNRGSDPSRYNNVTAHYAILPDGKILQLHPVSAYLYASNGFNARSVAVEFAGNFPNISGKCWKADKFGCHKVTQAQIDAGRYLVQHLIREIRLTHILAHRQSSGTRTNDPGPDIWYHVGQWAIDNHGLKDGGAGFKIGTGNAIPDEWRNWGRSASQPELMLQSGTDPEFQEEIDPETPDHIRWLQRGLNHVLGVRLAEDGILGPVTRSALRRFQSQRELNPSGALDLCTERYLMAAGAPQHRHPVRSSEVRAFEFHPEYDDTDLTAETWEGEVNRRSPEYIRWVQQALNQILGLRLQVDGIIGPATGSAIRSFQQREGLAVDGIVGPQTERALAARVGSLPVTGTGVATGIAVSDLNTLRANVVRIANQEWERWNVPRKQFERDPQIRQILLDYWHIGPRWRVQASNLGSKAWQARHPWSAAFISWVMRKARAGGAFTYSAAHATYIKAAKDNRLANNDNPFKAYRITEVKPEPGDLVCKSRAGSGATYENIRRGMKTHCDIVTEVHPGRLTTIGGNVSDSVSKTPVTTNMNGYVNDPRYFAVIKLVSPAP
jgi:hypothetical protein